MFMPKLDRDSRRNSRHAASKTAAALTFDLLPQNFKLLNRKSKMDFQNMQIEGFGIIEEVVDFKWPPNDRFVLSVQLLKDDS